ncbi:hypothetical protein KA977_03295 [Candidatus Dependentiae bacterium]|nr:hypothetical protein [Candidatus Dependentiae bacterium]
MKIVFIGMIGLGSVCLSKLISSKFDISIVITESSPDNKLLNSELSVMENIRKQTFSEYIKYNYIADTCLKNNLQCYTTDDLNNDMKLISKLKNSGADTLVVCTYDKKISNEIINIFKTAINIHPALLPEFAGPSPVIWSIRNNAKFSGVTIHLLTDKFDAGNIISKVKINIEPFDTGSSLNFKIMNYYGPELLKSTLNEISAGRINPVKQDLSKRQYYPAYKSSFSEINFESMTAEDIHLIVRAGNFYYPAFFTINSKTIILWETAVRNDISCGSQIMPGEVAGFSENSGLLVMTKNKIIELISIQLNDTISPRVSGDKLPEIIQL